MTAQKEFSRSEVRRTIATSLATAFGLVIALIWNNVVTGGLKVVGINLDTGTGGPVGWGILVVTAIILTVVMVLLIIVISRWGGKEPVATKPA